MWPRSSAFEVIACVMNIFLNFQVTIFCEYSRVLFQLRPSKIIPFQAKVEVIRGR